MRRTAQYAAEIQATLSAEDIASSYARIAMPVQKDKPLCDFVVPYGRRRADDRLDRRRRRELGGADRAGARRHRRDRHAGALLADHRAGQSGQAKKGMVNAAKVMAGVAVEALTMPH